MDKWHCCDDFKTPNWQIPSAILMKSQKHFKNCPQLLFPTCSQASSLDKSFCHHCSNSKILTPKRNFNFFRWPLKIFCPLIVTQKNLQFHAYKLLIISYMKSLKFKLISINKVIKSRQVWKTNCGTLECQWEICLMGIQWETHWEWIKKTV